MNNVLITGGTGFIGSHIVDKLLFRNYTVICLDNFDKFYNPDIKKQNIKDSMLRENFKLVEGDIRDKNLLNRIFTENKIDIVIHLAAKAGVRSSLREPELYYDVNVIGTLNLLESMRLANVKKLLFASSSSVYGNNNKIPFSEMDTVDKPISPYAATKKACELMCYTYHKIYDFDVFCLRYFSVYGPRQRPEMAIHNFAKKIINNEPISVYGDGTSKRDYTYIDDIIDGTMSAMNHLHGYEIFNFGESKTYSLNTVISLLEKYIGKKAIIKKMPEQPGDVKITNADITKAKTMLGYDPKIDLETGIKKFVNWLMTYQL